MADDSDEIGVVPDDAIFRREAVDYYSNGRIDGELLLIPPDWTRWTYWLILGVFVVALLLVTFVNVPQYAEGLAIIRDFDDARIGLLGTAAVESVGQTSIASQVDLGRPATGPVQSERDVSGTTKAERSQIQSTLSNRPTFLVIASFRAQDRRWLSNGTSMRLELVESDAAHQDVTIARVAPHPLSGSQIAQLLGEEAAEALRSTGPRVLVYAFLAGSPNSGASDPVDYFDGMHAKARVSTGSERLVQLLVPRFAVGASHQ